MYEFGFIMGVCAFIGVLAIYKYRAEVWAWLKKTVVGLIARIKKQGA